MPPQWAAPTIVFVSSTALFFLDRATQNAPLVLTASELAQYTLPLRLLYPWFSRPMDIVYRQTAPSLELFARLNPSILRADVPRTQRLAAVAALLVDYAFMAGYAVWMGSCLSVAAGAADALENTLMLAMAARPRAAPRLWRFCRASAVLKFLLLVPAALSVAGRAVFAGVLAL